MTVQMINPKVWGKIRSSTVPFLTCLCLNTTIQILMRSLMFQNDETHGMQVIPSGSLILCDSCALQTASGLPLLHYFLCPVKIQVWTLISKYSTIHIM